MDYNIDMNKNNHGFTLIELIVTISVISILAVAASPNLGSFLTRNKLTSQTNNFVSSLSLARSEAAKRGGRITVCIGNPAQNACDGVSTSWESGWISFVDLDSDSVIDAGETILNVNNDVSGDTTIRSTEHLRSITYRGDGSTSAAGTFRICDSEGNTRAKAINIMGSGLISQAKDNDADQIVDNFQGISIVCP